jgi:hypothetical protein
MYIQPTFSYFELETNKRLKQDSPIIACTIPAYKNTANHKYSLTIVDTSA